MKTKDILIITAIVIAFLHVTFTPIILTNYLNSHKEAVVDYTTHYAKGDSINYEVINLVNSEIYEEQ